MARVLIERLGSNRASAKRPPAVPVLQLPPRATKHSSQIGRSSTLQTFHLLPWLLAIESPPFPSRSLFCNGRCSMPP